MSLRSRLDPAAVPVAKVFGPGVPPAIEAAEARAQMTPASPFSPGEPIGPYDGFSRTPRTHDFVTSYNTAARPRSHERVSFETLKGLVESYDVAQIVIRHRISSLRSLDWQLIAAQHYDGDVKREIEEGMKALKRPDRKTLFKPWLAKYLRGILSYDAGTLYRMRNRGGRAIGLKVLDGTLIAPLQDYWGDRPGAPAPAYVQYVNGLPWNWLTEGDLIYEPFDPQDDSLYGRAPLEDILLNANTDLRFQLYFLSRFTQGNLPAAFAGAPESWTPDQIEQFQEYWDAFMTGDLTRKHQVRWIPGGSSFAWSDEKDFSDSFSLFLMRKTCAAYSVVPSDLGFTECYSEDTECLTDRGWMRYDELQDADRVATYNPQTREIEYHVPVHKFVSPYEGEMIRFKSRSQDILVTPGHRMWAWTQTRDRTPGLRPWREIRADKLAGMSRFGFVGHAVFDAPDIDDVVIPAVASKGRTPADRRIPMDLMLEFLGYMIAEGCVHRQSPGIQHYNVSISQSNTANPEKVRRFTRCLEQLPVSWTVRDHERDGCRVWSVGDKSLWTWLAGNIGQGSRGKRLPGFFRQLGKRQATILLDALLLGDGTIDDRPWSTGREYGTMSAQLASDVQELAYKLGYRVSSACNKIGFWRVNITDGRDHQLGRQQVTREAYKGTVWCLEVPHHLFVTRRNGKIAVQGNSVNRSSGESQADVQHRVGDLPLAHHVQDILTSFLQDDLQLPLEFAFDLGEEQDDRYNQAQADEVYIRHAVVSASEIREMRFGLPEPDGQTVPRGFFTERAGLIPLNAVLSVSGEIDTATGAPVPGAPLPHEVFGGTEGVLPNPPIKVMSLAEQEFGPGAMPPAPPPQPKMQPADATGAPVAKEGETAGITAATGITSYDLIGDEDEDEPEAVAKELAAFRRFARARRKAGQWRNFTFEHHSPSEARELNRSGAVTVAKAAGEIAVAGLAVLAADTGRVLMLQRALSGDDPAAGTWEFPGGHCEGDESPLEAAWREWSEETGCPPPAGSQGGSWTSADGIYQGIVWVTAREASVSVRGGAIIPNPDDPDGDASEAIAWWDPADLAGNPALRPELAASLPDVLPLLGCAPDEADVAKAGEPSPKREGRDWPGWKLDLRTADHWSPVAAAAARKALPKTQLHAMAGDYLEANPEQQGDAPGKRDRNRDAAAWLLAWLAARGITLGLGPAARGIAADSYMAGAASAQAAVSGDEDADTAGWTPGDTAAAAAVVASLGAGDELDAVLSGDGEGTAAAAEGVLGDGFTGSLAVILTGYDADESAAGLSLLLDAAAESGDWAVSPVLTQVTTFAGQAAMDYYLANTTSLLQWVDAGDGRVCPACLRNAAAEPRHAGEAWPAGATAPPQHPGGCRCALVPVS